MQTITVEESARDQITEILSEGGKYVRAFIQGGGCSGFNYGFIVEDDKEDDDLVIDSLIIDSMSMQYFNNAIISFSQDKLKGSSFIITNPNAKSTCGCGSSFSI